MRPRSPLLVLLLLWAVLGLGLYWWPVLMLAWRWIIVVLAALALMDALLLWRAPSPGLRRELATNLAMGLWSPVRLWFENRSSRSLRLMLHDLHPLECAVEGLPARLRLAPNQRSRLEYRLQPRQRGDFVISGCDCALISPLGLWRQRRCLEVASRLRVFPDFGGVHHHRLLAAHERRVARGPHLLPRRGSGTEFHALRDYRSGDALHAIDWKATARAQRLIAREYEDERDQRLVMLLDCGRHMRHADQGRGHLDEALNALLLLARVALRQGDAVGLMTYGGVRRWLAPRKDGSTLKRLLQTVYDLQPTLEASDVLGAARDLLRVTPRRALIVLVTNTRGEDSAGLEQALSLLRQRHLVVLADLRESALEQALDAPIRDVQSALRFHALHQWFEQRRERHQRLHHLGIQVLDLIPSRLPLALIERYSRIKRAAVL